MSTRSRFLEGFLAGFRNARLSERAKAAAVLAGGAIALFFLVK
jgi:hypothetical protein